MNLVYNIKDKPKFGQTLLFALQQLLAIMAATIAVPAIINNGFDGVEVGMSQTAALFGAGVGTLVYLLFTKFRSPVFLGSSFAFIGSMFAAFAGAVSTVELGYVGLIIGACFAGLVYVIIAIVVKFVGVKWINKLMPAIVIGPTVAIIGLSLASNAVGDLVGTSSTANTYVCIVCGLVTLAVTMLCSVYGKKMLKMIPFVIGILAGYAVASIFTVIGLLTKNEALQVINFSLFKDIAWLPSFTFQKIPAGFTKLAELFKMPVEAGELNKGLAYLFTIAVAYVPVAFVVFAEHIADHKNLSSIVGVDLTKDPGLHRTLLGDGIGSFAGALFGGCPNTTYGESIGCVAISGNASVVTILCTAIMAIVVSFIGPFATFLATIPACVMGGVCIALYGFIAVSGLKMIQKVDLNNNRNLFVVSVILIAGVGKLAVSFGSIELTEVACALILGILTNLILGGMSKKHAQEVEPLEATMGLETEEKTEE